MGWKIFADTGGTFTDCLGQDPQGAWHTCKVLSDGTLRARVETVDVEANAISLDGYGEIRDGFFSGYTVSWNEGAHSSLVHESSAACLNLDGASGLPKVDDIVLITASEEAPVLGARMLTQTCLSGRIDADVLNLATTRGTNALLEENGARVLLITSEGFEDVLVIDDQRRSDIFALEHAPRSVLTAGVLGVPLRRRADGAVESNCSEEELNSCIQKALIDHRPDAVAVCFPHSYRVAEDEKRVGAILDTLDVAYHVQSIDLSRLGKFLPRVQTTVVDAYLGPIMEAYLDKVSAPLDGTRLRVMTSAGGLKAREDYFAKDGLLSGPAGGITGVAAVASRAGFDKVIAFDMGGTSTDVSRVDGELELKNQHQVGKARIQAAALRIETVAAGGGSVCSIKNGQFCVGPESARAYPGPACYGAGGPLTVTDVNLLLGRINEEQFQVPIDRAAAEQALNIRLDTLKREHPELPASANAVLEAFRDIANRRMADALRLISIKEGFDPEGYTLVAFGGAGGQHACALARLAGMQRILIPAHAGILSAFALAQARDSLVQLRRLQTPIADQERLLEAVGALEETMSAEASEKLDSFALQTEVEVRFIGQETTIDLKWTPDTAELEEHFLERYQAMFGYVPSGRPVEVVNVRCRATADGEKLAAEHFVEEREASDVLDVLPDPYTTIVVEPGWKVSRGSEGSTLLEYVGTKTEAASGAEASALLRDTLISNRLHGVVVEMGEQLERTAVSTNVKERLDFSCALTDADGVLLFNAPHIPVHLGALGVCVRRVLDVLDLQEGDVAITNHPGFGGSHLPDISLIQPIFAAGERVGFAVNRAHHAEVGGIAPGSMSPFAKNLEEEGVVFYPQYLLRAGEDCFPEIEKEFLNARYPSRRVEENLADLRAQLAALKAGAAGVVALIENFGLEAYRNHISQTLRLSAAAMRERIQGLRSDVLRGESLLDDGDRVAVALSVKDESLVIDFEGTSPVRSDSLNANEAIARSAILYVLRLWLGDQVSMNEGVLEPIDIRLPESLVSPVFARDPASCPGVVGGNVEVSQRIVDALLDALKLQAGAQATMNNFIFGDETRSYYETICGGSGAGDGYAGASAVHTHMTNTSITDVEILEERYPVVLESFALRKNSGGVGKFPGGEGIVRKVRFLEPMTVSLLAQSRNAGGKGQEGGDNGEAGEQVLIRDDERRSLPGLFSETFAAGDVLEIRTPGGGGWGSPY